MSFLRAEWRKLVIANYLVDPNILSKYLPAKTELHLWKGGCFVSLVGFMFLNTRMLGMRFPFHQNFEEVNLRFYVRHYDGNSWKRGVVFIKEVVPKPLLALVANTVYGENYLAMKMNHFWKEEEFLQVGYSWGQKSSITVLASKEPNTIQEDSETEFITEHYWGYTRINEEKTYEYEVTHPRWEHYPVISHDIQVNFAKVYGGDFSILNNQAPVSVMLAEGSEITVENKRIL